MAKKSSKTESDFAVLLQVPLTLKKEVLRTRVQARLINLGHANFCSRCGGCGSYSSNAVDGTRCYGCGGTGYVANSYSDELYQLVQKDVDAGKLDIYLCELAVKSADRKKCKEGRDKVMKHWIDSKNSLPPSDWRKAVDAKEGYDREISDFVNKPMSKAYDAVSKLNDELMDLTNRKCTTIEEREAKEKQVEQLQQKLAVQVDESMRLIDEATEIGRQIATKYNK